jgi:predicted neuraminidase
MAGHWTRRGVQAAALAAAVAGASLPSAWSDTGASADADGAPPARAEVAAPSDGRVNHAPGLVELPSGALLVCWYSASSEAGADARILCSRSADRGISWRSPKLAVGPGDQAAGAREPNKSVGNVVLHADASGRAWMIHGVIQRRHVPLLGNLCLNWRCGRVDGRLSLDGGQSWSGAARLDDQIGALPRAGVVRHPELGHLLPLYLEGEEASYVREVEFGAGGGVRLGPALVIPTRGVIQPSLVLQRDGRVHAFLRDTAAVAVRTAVLDPRTRRWGEAVATDLPNPGAAVEAFADDGGRFVVIHNPSRRHRRALRLAASWDGTHFVGGCDLVREGQQGEVAYPAAIRARDGAWHVVYSGHAKTTIRHVRFGSGWLRRCLDEPGR